MLTLTAPAPSPRALLDNRPGIYPPAATGPISGHGNTPVAFTGDWLADGCRCHTYREGYAGILTRRWNGWAVFTVTRPVAQAIVAHHQSTSTALMHTHMTGGADVADAWLATLAGMPSVCWLDDLIVVDSRVLHADETMVEISAPSAGGRYSIGWGWRWDDVDSTDIHTVHTGQTR
jgi:hypothetical protein